MKKTITFLAIFIIVFAPLLTCFKGTGDGLITIDINLWVAIYYGAMAIIWRYLLTWRLRSAIIRILTIKLKEIE